MKIRFLLLNAYAVGGTVRTVVNQANALAEAGHDVEITSVHRHRPAPVFALHGRVRLRALVDDTAATGTTTSASWPRRRIEAWLGARPSQLVPAAEVKYHRFSRLTDRRLVRYLRSLDGGVLITTRPALNLLSARFTPASVIGIGQEHLHHAHHKPALDQQIGLWYPRLDALTVLTEADRGAYTARLGSDGPRIVGIPNPLPAGSPTRSTLDRPLVLSAGRLVKAKGFDSLIEAFAPVAEAHPDWQLRIYGSGPERDRLRALIHRWHLYNHVYLMGSTPHLEAELAKASVFALASRHEGFGMVLAEAMSHGVPPVSFDCPHGPREIITGGDGLLISPGDTRALTQAVTHLIERPTMRAELGEQAAASALRYRPERIRAQWETLIAELAAKPGRERPRGRRRHRTLRVVR
ncbi:glycosyltransferase family 4 protein [Streptomyces sp. NPDC032198]|uniref:glycosyltransferase family 4 protein n=1 Tax=Streptomyces sp. NPDC032198 TaxID=3155127 RepID=UPI0033DAFE80